MKNVKSAIKKLILQPGFKQFSIDFNVIKWELNKTHWENGFTVKSNFPLDLIDDNYDQNFVESNKNITSVYLLTHFYDINEDEEDIRYIGIYDTQKKANDAVKYLQQKKGFKKKINFFNIDLIKKNNSSWQKGFVTVF